MTPLPYVSSATPTPGPNGELGQVVRSLRVFRKLRIQDVADPLGIERAHLGRLELGRCRWKIDTLHAVAELLETTVARLMEDAGL